MKIEAATIVTDISIHIDITVELKVAIRSIEVVVHFALAAAEDRQAEKRGTYDECC